MDGLTKFLPLPTAVVETALTGRHMVLKSMSLPSGYPYCSSHLIKEARRGLPQGAASSPAVSHLCVAHLAKAVADLEYLFNYEDDFLVLAKSQAELMGRVAQLTEAVGTLPGGHFTLSVKSIAAAPEGLDFLGHHLSVRTKAAVAKPSEVNLLRLTTYLANINETTGVFSSPSGKVDKETLLQCSADKLATIRNWKGAFQACSKATEEWAFVECLEAEIYSDLSLHGLSASQLPNPGKHSSPKARNFFYYKWFS